MPEIEIITVTTLTEFVASIEELATDPTDPIWYRGTGCSDHKLLPSLYRHPTKSTSGDLLELERELIGRFRERAVPFQDAVLEGEWEYLFLMQHFGVPTRLLDWTENPLIALFFALTSAKPNKDGTFNNNVSVWVLSPRFWNQKVFSHYTYEGGPLSPTHTYLKQYSPDSPNHPPQLPVAIFGIHNSPRIVAQRGVFTIFGSSIKPMEESFQDDNFSANALKKIVVQAENIEPLLKKMISIGFTDSVMFPDLEGLARETKRLYGFL